MKHDHFNARLVLIDGPLALYICEASWQEIMDAYKRLGKLVDVAAAQLDGNGRAITKASKMPTIISPSHDGSLGDRNASEFP